jgi:hypothetical protein
MTATITNDRRAAAFDYVARGWAVMPLKPQSKDPHFELVRNAYKGATYDLSLVEHWFNYDPNTNIGIACITSGLVVIDIDYRNGGRLDKSWAKTFTVQTGNGLHLYYTANQSMEFRGTLDKGIDVKWKGYVVAAPSVHPNLSTYDVIMDIDPVALPSDIAERIVR